MLFTYEMKIALGNDKSIVHEIDGLLEIERNGDWSIYLNCEDKNEYEPVCDKTDLYTDICNFLQKRYDGYVQDAIEDAQRSYRWRDGARQ